MNEQEWLGADNQLGLDIWKNKYCDNSPVVAPKAGKAAAAMKKSPL